MKIIIGNINKPNVKSDYDFYSLLSGLKPHRRDTRAPDGALVERLNDKKIIGALCATIGQPFFSFPDKLSSELLILSGMVKHPVPALAAQSFYGR